MPLALFYSLLEFGTFYFTQYLFSFVIIGFIVSFLVDFESLHSLWFLLVILRKILSSPCFYALLGYMLDYSLNYVQLLFFYFLI